MSFGGHRKSEQTLVDYCQQPNSILKLDQSISVLPTLGWHWSGLTASQMN